VLISKQKLTRPRFANATAIVGDVAAGFRPQTASAGARFAMGGAGLKWGNKGCYTGSALLATFFSNGSETRWEVYVFDKIAHALGKLE
jgi:hypothetical protein